MFSPPGLLPTAAVELPGKLEQPVNDGLQPLLVVLDLDHTLVCTRDNPSQGYDFCMARGLQRAWVWKRPGLDAFLDWLRSPGIEVAVYTAGSSSYAQEMIAHLDPNSTLFRRQLSRGDCVLEPPAKDLEQLEHDLRRTVLIDDSLVSFRLQPENGLPVRAFRHTDHSDCELQGVQRLLENLLELEDVREVLQVVFNLRGSISATLNQAKTNITQTLQAVHVTGAAMVKVNGRYVLSCRPFKCGRPVYVHEDRQFLRILWSERGDSWVIDDAEAKEYRYVATGRVDDGMPLGAEWSSCEDDQQEPGLLVTEDCQDESFRRATKKPGVADPRARDMVQGLDPWLAVHLMASPESCAAWWLGSGSSTAYHFMPTVPPLEAPCSDASNQAAMVASAGA